MKKTKLQYLKRLILADIDYSKIQRSLKINGMTWIFEDRQEQVPTKSDLRSLATELLDTAIEKAEVLGPSGYYIRASGGFTVSYYGYLFPVKEFADRLTLSFDISRVSLSYKDVAGEHPANYRSSNSELEDEVAELKERISLLENKLEKKELSIQFIDNSDLA